MNLKLDISKMERKMLKIVIIVVMHVQEDYLLIVVFVLPEVKEL